ncbi:CU044_5270 family protein [Nocardioides sp. NPDC092400]|uniref:CU044_5270 family protein n=1 Tax=Nocardioides sp. NPDC092400 TaxID=3155196 RepID=UPI00343A5DAF
MDEIDLLSRVRDDVATPDPATLAPARARLLSRAAGRPAARRRTPLLLAGAAGVALALAVGLVATNPVGTSPATAAELLQRAAERAADAPAPGPGQYLAVETREESLGYVQRGREVVGAYRTSGVTTTYVPHDRRGTWVRRYWSEQPEEVYGGAAVRRAADRDYAVSAHADDPGVEEGVAGEFGNGELGGGVTPVSVSDIPTLTRDAEELLDYLEDGGGVGADPGAAAVGSAALLLRSGLVPLDLRRALYEALALVPGVRVVDDTVTLDGRTGTAIGVHDGAYATSVVVDPGTGEYLGEVQTQLRATGAVPAGTVTTARRSPRRWSTRCLRAESRERSGPGHPVVSRAAVASGVGPAAQAERTATTSAKASRASRTGPCGRTVSRSLASVARATT